MQEKINLRAARVRGFREGILAAATFGASAMNAPITVPRVQDPTIALRGDGIAVIRDLGRVIRRSADGRD